MMIAANIFINNRRDHLCAPKPGPLFNKLPILRETERAAFTGTVDCRTMKVGSVLFQAQRTGQAEPGRWFGTAKPESARHAEILFNINKWGNDGGQIMGYLVLAPIPGYWGRVAGGLGLQLFVPESINLHNRLSML